MADKKPWVLGSARPTELEDTDGLEMSGNTHLAIPSSAGGPTINSIGRIGIDTTNDTFNFYGASAEQVLQPVRSAGFSIKDPDTTIDEDLFEAAFALTISEIVVVLRGTTPTVTWNLRHGSDRSAAGTSIDSNTSSSTTTGTSYTSLSDPTVPAGNFIWLEISATTGTVDGMGLTIHFTYDA